MNRITFSEDAFQSILYICRHMRILAIGQFTTTKNESNPLKHAYI